MGRPRSILMRVDPRFLLAAKEAKKKGKVASDPEFSRRVLDKMEEEVMRKKRSERKRNDFFF